MIIFFYFLVILYGFSRFYGLYIIKQFSDNIELAQKSFTFNSKNKDFNNIEIFKIFLSKLETNLLIPILGTFIFVSIFIIYNGIFLQKKNIKNKNT